MGSHDASTAEGARVGGLEASASDASARATGSGSERLASKLRALVLLGGSVRPSDLSRRIGRPLFQLPIDGKTTILRHWQRQAALLAEVTGLDRLPIKLVVDKSQSIPPPLAHGDRAPIDVMLDTASYRGTGGVLSDMARDLDDDDLLLVGTAGQVLLEPLAPLAAQLAESEGVAALVGDADGTPSGLMVIACRALRDVRRVGFVDLKEQVLPSLAHLGVVRAVVRDSPVGVPVRTLDGYLDALRRFHGSPHDADPFAEGIRSTFAVVEDGARVHEGATLHDAVVLEGSEVQQGGAVVRSVVCPGGVVGPGDIVVDSALAQPAASTRRRRRAG